jgi:hypothetical protein
MVYVIKRLPSNHKALNSKSVTTKQTKNKNIKYVIILEIFEMHCLNRVRNLYVFMITLSYSQA